MTLLFQIEYFTQWGEDVRVVGDIPQLGNDNPDQALKLQTEDGRYWHGKIDIEPQTQFRYHYLIYKDGALWRSEWEGDPRIVALSDDNECLLDNWIDRPADNQLYSSAFENVWRIQREASDETVRWKGIGTAIPLFSLRSANSFGVGDFSDLKLMVDWVAKTGQCILQLLPINDTTASHTWTDSYPYNSISIYALHPIYLDLRAMGTLKSGLPDNTPLNAAPQLDYEAVMQTKWQYFRQLYAQDGAKVLRSATYKRFEKDNKNWLWPYAAFCYLRDSYGTADFSQWKQYSTYDAASVEALFQPKSDTRQPVMFYGYLQYHAHRQLLDAAQYARKKGVVLKGDIPIGISRHSVEAWTDPHYFNMNGQTGAPPDDFAEDGQNWGFPTYNWDAMAKDDYSWWVKRLRHMSQYFDAYRIDHILGFFRIWEIPMPEKSGLLGRFVPALPMSREEIESFGFPFKADFFLPDLHETERYHPRIRIQHDALFSTLSPDEQAAFNRLYDHFYYHRHNDFWYRQAMRKLPFLTSATSMLACGEDLGMIPASVEQVMDELQILTLEVQRMPKAYGVEFGDVCHYPYRSVCTISTHDMSTLRGWWEEDAEQTQRYYNHVLGHEGEAPKEATPDLCAEVVRSHLHSNSMLTILTLQDWLSIDGDLRHPDVQAERINIPAQPRYYWRWRMHLTLEQLLNATSLNESIRRLRGV